MRRIHLIGLLARLYILVSIALLPAIVLILIGLSELRNRDRTAAQYEASRLARSMASLQEREFDATRNLLMAVSRMSPPIRPASDSTASDALGHDARLQSLLRQHPDFSDLAVADETGRVVRTAVSSSMDLNVADRPWFRAALRTRRFVVGEYEAKDYRNRPGVVLAFPSDGNLGGADGRGKSRTVAFATLNLNELDPAKRGLRISEHFAVGVMDRRGTVLFRRPNPKRWQGFSAANVPAVADLIANPRDLATEYEGADGRRLFGYSPVHVQDESVAFTGVSIPLNIAYAKAHKTILQAAALLSLMTILIIALTWYFGEMIIVSRLRRLAHATESVANGDRGVRTGLRHDDDAIGQLAGAFDNMATALDEREALLEKSEDALRKSEANYRLLFQTAPVAAGVYDTETLRFLSVNARAL